jgi:hypothetical protein
MAGMSRKTKSKSAASKKRGLEKLKRVARVAIVGKLAGKLASRKRGKKNGRKSSSHK